MARFAVFFGHVPGVAEPQIIVPIADISDGAWVPSGAGELYEQLDETPSSDADYISTESLSVCEVRLAVAGDPSVSTGHIVRYRARGDGATDLVVKLMEGATQIATWTETNVPAVVTAFSHTLSDVEADAISDYSDLRLRFEAA